MTDNQDERERTALVLESAARRIREGGELPRGYFTNPGCCFEDSLPHSEAKRSFETFVESGGDDGWPENADTAEWGMMIPLQTVASVKTEADQDSEWDFIMTLTPVDATEVTQ